ncbi:unnamed protein product [Gadus morhua 'NCC']
MLPAVFATTEDNKPVPIVVDRDALSLYTTPKETFNYVETEAGKLESGIAGIRTSLEPYSAWCQDVYGNIRPKVQRVTRFGNEGYVALDKLVRPGKKQNSPSDPKP